MRAYYFGCWESPGHYFWLPGSGGVYKPYAAWSPKGPVPPERPEEVVPWGYKVDGGFLRGVTEWGETTIVVEEGWTALSTWDSSVDERAGSCSVFIFEAELTKEQALAKAREVFPEVVTRIEDWLGPRGPLR